MWWRKVRETPEHQGWQEILRGSHRICFLEKVGGSLVIKQPAKPPEPTYLLPADPKPLQLQRARHTCAVPNSERDVGDIFRQLSPYWILASPNTRVSDPTWTCPLPITPCTLRRKSRVKVFFPPILLLKVTTIRIWMFIKVLLIMIGERSNEGISRTLWGENESPSYPAPLKRNKLFTERDQEPLTRFADPHRVPATLNGAGRMLWVCIHKHAARRIVHTDV